MYTDPLLAMVNALQSHLQDVLLVSVDLQPAVLLSQVCSCCGYVAFCLLLAVLPPALYTQLHIQHWQVTQEGPCLTKKEDNGDGRNKKEHIVDGEEVLFM